MYKLDLTPLHHIRYAFSEPFAGTTACVSQLQRNASPLSLWPGRLLNATVRSTLLVPLRSMKTESVSDTATETEISTLLLLLQIFVFWGVIEKVH